MIQKVQDWIAQTLAAIMFYTCLPIPSHWRLEFRGIARVAPIVGMFIGGLLGLLDWALHRAGVPMLTRSAIVVVLWVAITGGLHLDGAMDTADGLAVADPQRRLQVMSDSVTGAFGAMAAIAILLLKTAALSEIETDRVWIVMAAASWGRWGQLSAIALYPYLKSTGKGAFHKESIQSLWETLPSFLLLFGLSSVLYEHPMKAIALSVGGATIGLLMGAWLDHKLGGQTGDTYGAIVEWTEALLLCVATVF